MRESVRRLLCLVLLWTSIVLVSATPAFARTDNLSCADFATQAGAQAVYRQNQRDPFGLDADGNGLACDLRERLGQAMSSTTFVEWAQVAAPLIALAGLGGIWLQIRRDGLLHGADTLRELRDRYTSEVGMKDRQQAANAIIEVRKKLQSDPNNSLEINNFLLRRIEDRNDEDGLLDFFTRIGTLVKRGALDKRLVRSAFYNAIHRYCWSDKDYIRATQDKYPSYWAELTYLHKQLHVIDVSEKSPWALRRVLELGRRIWWRWSRSDSKCFNWVDEKEAPQDIEQFLTRESTLIETELHKDPDTVPREVYEREYHRANHLEQELQDVRNSWYWRLFKR